MQSLCLTSDKGYAVEQARHRLSLFGIESVWHTEHLTLGSNLIVAATVVVHFVAQTIIAGRPVNISDRATYCCSGTNHYIE